MTVERQRDMTHTQLLEQISLRISETQKYLGGQLDRQDKRLGKIESKFDEYDEKLTLLTQAIPVQTAEARAWAATPRWRRWFTYAAIIAACVAILGGLSAAYSKSVEILSAINGALIK